MKRIITLALYLVVCTFTIVSASANGDRDREATFTVDKMTCAACPITVRRAMQRVDGVKHVTVDFDAKTATVTYDSQVTNAEQIGESSGRYGYPATVIEDHAI